MRRERRQPAPAGPLALLALVLASCAQSGASLAQPRIESPLDGAVVEYGEAILFRASSGGCSLRWRLATGEIVCEGPSADIVLESGRYEVELLDGAVVRDRARFSIAPPPWSPGKFVELVEGKADSRVALSPGRYLPAIVNLSQDALRVSIKEPSGGGGKDLAPATEQYPPTAVRTARGPEAPLRDISIAFSGSRAVALTRPHVGACPSQIQRRQDSEATATRNFSVPDPSDEGETVHEVEATAIRSDESAVLWLDDSALLGGEDADRLWSAIARILPRCAALWGRWGPTSGDERIHVLATPILDKGGVAVGFFDPADVLPLDTNPGSPAYNPASNRCNLVTIGVPEAEPPGGSYSLSSLCATIAHELAHLILFERKSRAAFMAGSGEADRGGLPRRGPRSLERMPLRLRDIRRRHPLREALLRGSRRLFLLGPWY